MERADPIEFVACVVCSRANKKLRDEMQSLVEAIARDVDWPLGAPSLVDQSEVIDAQPGETDIAYEQRARLANIVNESANNVRWPIGPRVESLPTNVLPARREAVRAVRQHLIGVRARVHDVRRGSPSPDIEWREFTAIRMLCERLAAIAVRTRRTFIVEFADEEIGEIRPAGMDRGIATGLLGEWERTLRRE